VTQGLRLAAALLILGALVSVARMAPTRLDDGLPQQAAEADGSASAPAPPDLLHTAAGLGLLMLGSWLFANLLDSIGAPRVSSYLLFGLLVGPSVLGLVERGELQYLRLVNDLAIALIALTAGGEIRFADLKGKMKAIALITLGSAVGVYLTVTPTMYAVRDSLGFDADGFSAQALMLAFIIATLATANSPAVVIAVLTELKAYGPLSQFALSVTILKDLFLVVLFAVALAVAGAVMPAAAAESAAVPADGVALPLYLLQHLGGSIAAGAGLGLILAWYMRFIRAHLSIVIVLGSFGVALVSESLGLEPLIVALVAGLLMRNVWERQGEPLFEAIEELSLPVYCVFFAVAGAKIELGAVAGVWPLSLLLVVTGVAGVWLGTLVGCRLAGVDRRVSRWMPTAFIAKAGVSLALASVVERSFPGQDFAERFYNLVIVAIAVHELAGPVVFKWGLTRVGEVGAPRPQEQTAANQPQVTLDR